MTIFALEPTPFSRLWKAGLRIETTYRVTSREGSLRISIIGANLCNRGAESMLLTLIYSIQLKIEEANFSVWSYAGDDKTRSGTILHSEPNGIQIEFELAHNHKTLGLLLLQGLLAVVPFRIIAKLAARLSTFINDVDQADAVIDISGFALTGDRPWWRHVVYLLESRTAYSCNTPFLAMTQSFGPFRNRWQRLVATISLAQARMISARGAMSARHLEAIGLGKDQDLVIAPDITYLFDPAPEALAKEVLADAARPRIAVIPNTNIYRRSAKTSGQRNYRNTYVADMRKLCLSAIVEHNCKIAFIPHEGDSSRFDDSALVALIRDDPTISAHSIVLDKALPASTIKSAIIQCDAVITSRYHGMMAALSNAVPAFVPGWADKYEESADMAGSSEFTFNFGQSGPDSIVEHFTRFWEARDDIRQMLAKRLPQNRSDAKHAIDVMIKHLRSPKT